jgi:hypothetical protein
VRQLHVLGVSEDGATLLLGTTKNSTKPTHRIPLDERLRAATRGQLVANGDRAESALTPKEIQARMRGGASPEEVAKAAGIPVARVIPYFAPVEAERDRIVEEARAAVMHRQRGADGVRPLGLTVDAHLADVAGIKDDSVAWSARRRADGAWIVGVTYAARGGRRKAEWLWEPAVKRLSPLDPAAARLGAEVAAPKRRAAKSSAARPPARKAARKAPARKAAARKATTRKAATATKAAAPKRAAATKKAATTQATKVTKAVKKAPARKVAATKVAPAKATPTKAVKAAPTRAVAKKAAPVKATTRKAAATRPARPAKKVAAVRSLPVEKTRRTRRQPSPKDLIPPPPIVEIVPDRMPQPVPVPILQPEPEPIVAEQEQAPEQAQERRKPEPTPPAPRRPGQRVPLPSWSDVLLGVTGSRDNDGQGSSSGSRDGGGRRAG